MSATANLAVSLKNGSRRTKTLADPSTGDMPIPSLDQWGEYRLHGAERVHDSDGPSISHDSMNLITPRSSMSCVECRQACPSQPPSCLEPRHSTAAHCSKKAPGQTACRPANNLHGTAARLPRSALKLRLENDAAPDTTISQRHAFGASYNETVPYNLDDPFR